MNCEAYSSFEGVSSDHRIVTTKLRLSLRKNATRTATTKHYDWALLNNRDIRDKYALELRNRFETLQEKTEKGTLNDEYENFVEAHLEAASKYIPIKPRTKYRVPWDTLAAREKRALVKTAFKCYRKNPTNTNAWKLEKTHTHTHIYICIHISTNTQMYIFITLHIHTYTYIYSYIYTSAYTHISHIYMGVSSWCNG